MDTQCHECQHHEADALRKVIHWKEKYMQARDTIEKLMSKIWFQIDGLKQLVYILTQYPSSHAVQKSFLDLCLQTILSPDLRLYFSLNTFQAQLTWDQSQLVSH